MRDFIQHVVDAASVGSLYALIALGIAVIFGVMRLANFAHSQLIVIGAYAFLIFKGAPWVVIVAGSLVLAIVLGLAMERVAFRPLRSADASTLFIASFAVASLIENVMNATVGSQAKSVPTPTGLSRSVDIFGVSVPVLSIVMVVVTALLGATFATFLRRTSLGIQMRAAAEDFEMTRLLGVKANKVIALAFAISGLLAGVVGVFLVAQLGVLTPTMGLEPVIVGFVATVLGGMESLGAAALGGFAVGALSVALQVALPIELRPFRDAFVFGLVLLILVIRPQGLLVVKSAKERIT